MDNVKVGIQCQCASTRGLGIVDSRSIIGFSVCVYRSRALASMCGGIVRIDIKCSVKPVDRCS